MTNSNAFAATGHWFCHSAVKRFAAVFGLLYFFSALVGCSADPPVEVTWLNCRVLIGDQPAQDVKVTLLPEETLDNDFELVGITDHSGVAAMKLARGTELPAVPEIQLRASVESLGDWAIREPWCDLQRTPLKLIWNGTESPVEIQLPRKAVGSL